VFVVHLVAKDVATIASSCRHYCHSRRQICRCFLHNQHPHHHKLLYNCLKFHKLLQINNYNIVCFTIHLKSILTCLYLSALLLQTLTNAHRRLNYAIRPVETLMVASLAHVILDLLWNLTILTVQVTVKVD